MPQKLQFEKLANLVWDVAVGADGTVWAVFQRKDAEEKDGGKLFKWDWSRRRWVNPAYVADQFACRVAVDPEGLPVIIDPEGVIRRYDGNGSWREPSTRIAFRSVAVSPDGDVVGVQDKQDGSEDGSILRWREDDASDPFDQLGPDGATAKEVAAGANGEVWVINSVGGIWLWSETNRSWAKQAGAANAIATGGGQTWLNLGPAAGGGQLFIQDDSKWQDAEVKDFIALRVAVGPDGLPWVVDREGRLWRGINHAADGFLGLMSAHPVMSPKRPWDMLFVLRTSEINRVLSGPEQGTLIDVEKTSEVTGSTGRVKGSVASWQVVDSTPNFDRSGSKVDTLIFRLDLEEVGVSGGLALSENEVVTFERVSVFVEMSLRYVRKAEDTTTHQLVLAPPPSAADDAPEWDIDPEALSDDKKKSVASTLLTLLDTWLEDNWAMIDHVFAEIDLFEEIDGQDATWLHPTAIDYTYYAAKESAESVLCVLAMTHDREPDHRADFVLPNMLGEDTHALVHLGPELFMRNLIMSSLPGAIPGSRQDHFSFNDDLGTIDLSQEISMPDQPIGHDEPTGQRNYPCPTTMTRFNVELFGDALYIDSEVKVLARVHKRELWPPVVPKGTYIKPHWRDYVEDLAYVIADEKRYLTATHKRGGGIELVPDEDRTIATSRKEDLPKSKGDIAMDWIKMIFPMLLGLVPGVGPLLMALQVTWQALLEELWDSVEKGELPDPVGLDPKDLASRLSMSWGGFGPFEVQAGEIDHGLTVTGTLKPEVEAGG